MKVALIGAGGAAGSRILHELIARGHQVLALARTPSKVPALDGVTVRPLDANDTAALADAAAGCDAVISATSFKDTNLPDAVAALQAAGMRRFICVGGAGSLMNGAEREMDSPRFPAVVKPEAIAAAAFLDHLNTTADLDWTFISPSRFFEKGQRTGGFRIGKDDLLFDESGRSAISMDDYAIALVDELEHPAHIRQRFTVGY